MFKDKRVYVVVPAYNEENFIESTVSGIPDYVDKIIVVNDASTDKTAEVLKKIVSEYAGRLVILNHEKNRGVGAAIVTGYQKALNEKADIAVVMAGDGQMDPNDMPSLLEPIITDNADYVKGNRLLAKDIKNNMPFMRYFGNSILTIFTKIATGCWHVMDPQCGYTAISLKALEKLPLDSLYPRYGFPNDVLTKLNVFNLVIKDVSVTAIYGEEKSGIKLYLYIPSVLLLLGRCFIYRMKEKYLLRNFHPLLLFYFFGVIMSTVGIITSLWILQHRLVKSPVSVNMIMLAALLLIMGFQFVLFAMLFDFESNNKRT